MKPEKNNNLSTKIIGITLGDPAGIGPECFFKSIYSKKKPNLVIISEEKLIKHLLKSLKINIRLNVLESLKSFYIKEGYVNIFNPGIRPPLDISLNNIKAGYPSKDSAWYAFYSLKAATVLALRKEIACLITGPVCKETIQKYILKTFKGHTEFFSKETQTDTVCMSFLTEENIVGLATTHIPLKSVSHYLKIKDLKKKILLLNSFGKSVFDNSSKFALLGLNPHAGENGLFGKEEQKIIKPLIDNLKKESIEIEGPFPADAFWSSHNIYKRYKIIMALYHDQGLIPVKSGLLGKSVHITLGLPFLRLSVDHGTAFDIAGKNKASFLPTLHTIQTAESLIEKFENME